MDDEVCESFFKDISYVLAKMLGTLPAYYLKQIRKAVLNCIIVNARQFLSYNDSQKRSLFYLQQIIC